MKLLIDIGNQRMKWVTSADLTEKDIFTKNAIEHRQQGLSGALYECFGELPRPRSVWVSSVANPLVEVSVRECTKALWGLDPTFIKSSGSDCGVTNRYRNPKQLGVDRWMVAIAAKNRYEGRGCVVVDAGTAVTLDFVDAAGVFQGGVIFPGVWLMQKTLNMRTEKITIPSPNAHSPDEHVEMMNKDTQTAVRNGALLAVSAGIQSGIDRLIKEADSDCVVVMTGGDGEAISALLKTVVHLDPNLVFRGMDLISEQEKK